jgi:transposase
MRGEQNNQIEMFSCIPLEHRIPKNHPLRKIKKVIDDILSQMNEKFDTVYSNTGRPSIPPESLIKALFLQILYGVRSERQILEQIEYNLLYRWFVGLSMDDKIWDETVFTKNRNRLLGNDMLDEIFQKVIEKAKKENLISADHFTVDGTLLEAWASLKNMKNRDEGDDDRKDDGDKGNPSVDFHGEKRTNETHVSGTDPESRIYRKSKGQAAKLNYMGHIVMENRNGLAVNVNVTQAGYYSEHEACILMCKGLKGKSRKTLGADKHYDNDELCRELRNMKITPHVAQKLHAKKYTSAADGRTTRHAGYVVSQRKRKRIEEIFGWLKQFSVMRRQHFHGMEKVGWIFKFSVAVYNVLRIGNLLEA